MVYLHESWPLPYGYPNTALYTGKCKLSVLQWTLMTLHLQPHPQLSSIQAHPWSFSTKTFTLQSSKLIFQRHNVMSTTVDWPTAIVQILGLRLLSCSWGPKSTFLARRISFLQEMGIARSDCRFFQGPICSFLEISFSEVIPSPLIIPIKGSASMAGPNPSIFMIPTILWFPNIFSAGQWFS